MSANADKVIAYARAQIGKPYVFGAAGPNSFDCSGLTMRAYEQIGVKLTHFTGAQYAELDHRPYSQVQPGDLVFYANAAEGIYHVVLAIGGGQCIAAPQPGENVKQEAIWDQDRMSNVGIMPGGDGTTSVPAGTTPGGDQPAGGAPYTVAQAQALPRPLTTAQRRSMIGYIQSATALHGGSSDLKKLQSLSDSDLVTAYCQVYVVVNPTFSNLPSATDIVNEVLAPFRSNILSLAFWKRSGLIVLGFLIVIIAVILAFTGIGRVG